VASQDPAKQITLLLKKVNDLTGKTEQLEAQISFQFYILAALLGLIFLFVMLVWFYIPPPVECGALHETGGDQLKKEL